MIKLELRDKLKVEMNCTRIRNILGVRRREMLMVYPLTKVTVRIIT